MKYSRCERVREKPKEAKIGRKKSEKSNKKTTAKKSDLVELNAFNWHCC